MKLEENFINNSPLRCRRNAHPSTTRRERSLGKSLELRSDLTAENAQKRGTSFSAHVSEKAKKSFIFERVLQPRLVVLHRRGNRLQLRWKKKHMVKTHVGSAGSSRAAALYVFSAYAHTCRANAVLGVWSPHTGGAHDGSGLPGAVCARDTPLNGV